MKNLDCVYYYNVVNYKFVMSHVIDKKSTLWNLPVPQIYIRSVITKKKTENGEPFQEWGNMKRHADTLVLGPLFSPPLPACLSDEQCEPLPLA